MRKYFQTIRLWINSKKTGLSAAFWVFIFFSYLLILIFLPVPEESFGVRILLICKTGSEPELKRSIPPGLCRSLEETLPPKLGKLLVSGPQEQNYTEWERKEAIKFGFDELLATINYLFIGAGALIAFVGKNLIEPIIKKKDESPHLDVLWNSMALKNCLIASGVSIIFGIFARAGVIPIGSKAVFSIYGEIGVKLFFQEVTFGIAVLCLVVAFLPVANKTKIPEKQENEKGN